ncbi:MAG: ABC transporter substrate-binding protein [Desulfovibrio sp.]|nr:ABC transporter substrate-binding protein [Desulfovibrio sp.]
MTNVIPRFWNPRAGAAIIALFACLFMTDGAWAQPGQEAREALSAAVNRIMADIKSPDFSNPATREAARGRIENEVYKIFDFGEFSSRTVGPRWKQFSAEEKKRFADAFAKLLFNTYLNKVTGYNGEQVAYNGETVSPDGKLAEVKTTITLKDGKRTPVNYRMLLKDGSWRVYDVIIENISLVRNYRTQFQDILKSATPDQLIERINQKAKEVIAQGAGK